MPTTTPKLTRKEAIKAELAAIIEQEKRDHEGRIYSLGRFLFPPDPDMSGEPVTVLAVIVPLIPKQPIEALNKLIEFAERKRSALAARAPKKTPSAATKRTE